MNGQLLHQEVYWNGEVAAFDAIYSHEKSRLANWLDKTFRWDMYARFQYTMQSAEPISRRSFLDIGCGTGRYAIEFARRGAKRVVGIDVAPEMIRVCEERAREAQVANQCSFLKGDLLAYDAAETFDVCIGIGLFDYLEQPLPVLSKMREVVTDRAIISLPRLWTWRAPVRKARLTLRGCDVYFYSRQRTGDLLKAAGFKRYELAQIGQLYCVTAYV